MNESENFHDGHRGRMIEKVCSGSQGLEDHELLEVLLFYSIPRKDTNVVAHRLLRYFGSIENVFSAKAEDLILVEGVGKKTAAMIKTCGAIMSKIQSMQKLPPKNFLSLASYKADLIERFKGELKEKFLIVLVDKNYLKLTELTSTSSNRNFVAADIPELVHAFAINKPTGIILAHNHPSGNVLPSKDDDFATAKINMLCSVHGVTLIDHLIVCGKEVYSYHTQGRLDDIKYGYSIDNVLKTIKE